MIYDEQGIEKRYGLKPGPPIVAWDLARNQESVRRLVALSPHVMYVGHGGPFQDLSDLIKTN